MDAWSRLATLPLSVRALLVAATALTVNQLFAVYLESAVAAAFGWPLVALTAATAVVVVLDGIRRGAGRLLG